VGREAGNFISLDKGEGMRGAGGWRLRVEGGHVDAGRGTYVTKDGETVTQVDKSEVEKKQGRESYAT